MYKRGKHISIGKIKLKKGDEVLVIAGKDKDKRGKIIETLPSTGKVIIDGVNIVTRHQRPKAATRSTPRTQTGIIKKPAPMDVSKVMIICPRCGHPTRIGVQHVKERDIKARICRRGECGEFIDNV